MSSTQQEILCVQLFSCMLLKISLFRDLHSTCKEFGVKADSIWCKAKLMQSKHKNRFDKMATVTDLWWENQAVTSKSTSRNQFWCGQMSAVHIFSWCILFTCVFKQQVRQLRPATQNLPATQNWTCSNPNLMDLNSAFGSWHYYN